MIINTEMLLKFGITFGCVFLLSVLLLHWLIPILKSKKVGQKILTIGPRWHMAKEGTPTMGGIGFIVAILVTLCGVSVYYFICHQSELLLPLALTIAEEIEAGLRPALVIGVPVGFVNVVESKETLFAVCEQHGVPAIVAMGRKGGSNVAAAICNALVYSAAEMLDPAARGWRG